MGRKQTSLTTALLSLTLAVGVGSLAACHTQEPTSPTVGLTKAADPPEMPDLGRGAARTRVDVLYGVSLAEGVGKACAGPAPFFEFDSSDAAKDQPTMQVLARCMIDGPLRGKKIKLIGHTDPRGTESYNDNLGLERAERVRAYLVAHGVAEDRVQARTAGEDEARAAPAAWAKDRRVEIQLGE
jgi:peptidoglycan-associated lipoprotein